MYTRFMFLVENTTSEDHDLICQLPDEHYSVIADGPDTLIVPAKRLVLGQANVVKNNLENHLQKIVHVTI